MREGRLKAVGQPPYLSAESRHGIASGEAGVAVALREGLAVASVAERRGKREPLAAATRTLVGMVPPAAGRVTEACGTSMVWIGPSQWLIFAPAASAPDFVSACAKAFDGLASVTDQSDGRVVLWIGGARACDALAKGVMVDLNDAAFAPGSAAVTAAAKIGITLWRTTGKGLELAVSRSYLGSFWRFLVHASAEYGLNVLPPLAGFSSPGQP